MRRLRRLRQRMTDAQLERRARKRVRRALRAGRNHVMQYDILGNVYVLNRFRPSARFRVVAAWLVRG